MNNVLLGGDAPSHKARTQMKKSISLADLPRSSPPPLLTSSVCFTSATLDHAVTIKSQTRLCLHILREMINSIEFNSANKASQALSAPPVILAIVLVLVTWHKPL